MKREALLSAAILTTAGYGLAVASTSTALQAQASPAESGATGATAPAGAYVLDNDHTHVLWRVDRFGFADTTGSFVDVQGVLQLDPQAPEKSSVTATITLSGLRSDLAQREEIVRGKFWLDAETFPEIRFQSSAVTMVDGPGCDNSCAKVDGSLTIKGATRNVTLDVRLNKLGKDPVTRSDAAGFSASGSFKRSDFGIATALGPIGDDIAFQIEALAIKG